MTEKITPSIPNWRVHLAVAAGALLTVLAGFAQPGWCASRPIGSETHLALYTYPTPETLQSEGRMRTAQQSVPPPDYQNLSPKQKKKFQRNMQEWESLPPQERRTLRHRMEQWQGLSPEERSLYRKRYNQYQRLPQQERRSIQEKLEHSHTLSPREREELREKFNRR